MCGRHTECASYFCRARQGCPSYIPTRTQFRPQKQIAEAGLERVAENTEKNAHFPLGGAESGAVGARSGAIDGGLPSIVEAWPQLPEAVKADILAIVRAPGK
jgi:hypothetical protein